MKVLILAGGHCTRMGDIAEMIPNLQLSQLLQAEKP